jgi:hypothetical protein
MRSAPSDDNWTISSVAMQERYPLPASGGVPTAEEVVERALMRLLRGGTWEGLANELAWEAVRSTGAESSSLEWLPGLIEANLAERVDGVEFTLERARASARAEHLREWPNDVAGAETAAALAAHEEAERRLGRLYVNVLEWAIDLLSGRLDDASPGSGRLSLRRERAPSDPEVPLLVADSLAPERTRYGWPKRRRNAGLERPQAA